MRLAALACTAVLSGCVLPALVGGTTLAADELDEGTTQIALENELARNLASTGVKNADGAYTDVYWLSSDLAFRRGVTSRLGLEAAAKFAWALPLPLPAPIGVSVGALWRLDDPAPWLHLALRGQATLGGFSRTYGVGGQPSTKEEVSLGGGTLSFLATARPAEFVALTVSPFVRGYGYRWTKSGASTQDVGGFSPSAGLSANLQLRLWVVELAPMATIELAGNPTGGAPLVVPMLGFSGGLRF